MEQYIVSARKYRPSSFKTVVGQKSLTATLKNAIDSDRLAQAYLFCGPRGVGKTSCARIFAKTINCLHPTAEGEACNECESCRAFNEGRSLNIVELDAASNNSVDDIRNLTDQVRVPPQLGKYRVFIIDEVHMLSVAAFNAFLKTLEEPPKYVIFILATTEKHKVIPTILSRCQIYDFTRITINDIVEHLSYVASEEGITAEPAALNVNAQKADGAMRDALSIFDQVAASSMNNITYQSAIANLNVLDYEYYFRLVDAFLQGNVVDSLLIYKEVRDNGFDSLFFVNGLANHIRDLMVAADPRTLPLLEVSNEVGEKYVEQAKRVHPKWCYAAMEHCNSCDLNYRTSTNKQFLVELTLIRLCQLIGGAPVTNSESKPMSPVKPTSSAPQSVSQGSMPSQPAGTAMPTAQESRLSQSPKVSMQRVELPQTKEVKAPAKRTSMRISDIMSDSKEETERENKMLRNKPIIYDELKDLWFQFIYQHPEMHIVVNAMRNAIPECVGDSLYKIMVDNPAQMQAIEQSMGEILTFMRNGLENDMFALNIDITPNIVKERMMTPIEFINKLMDENPVISEGLRRFNAEIV